MRKASAVVAAFVALAAGCGGGGGERLSRDAYVAKADAVCRQANTARRSLQAPSSLDGIPAYVGRVLPAVDTEISQLHALRPPADMEPQVKDWLSAVGEFRNAL